jgi:hypothetical protein
MLGGADELDLRAHQRPVHGKERHQPIVATVAAAVSVGRHEPRADGFGAVRRQVHDQERQVVGDVEGPQIERELDTVDHAELGPQDHVLGAEVGVTLLRQPTLGTLVEHAGVGAHEGPHQSSRGRQRR